MTRFSFPVFLPLILLLACGIDSLGQRKVRQPASTPAPSPLAEQVPPTGEIIGKRIVFVDGSTIDVDDTWKQGGSVWYRLHGLSRSVDREVEKVEDRYKEAAAPTQPATTSTTAVDNNKPPVPAPTPIVWIYLKDGARMRVDEVREVPDGAWYNRRNVAIFLSGDRIARIEREMPGAVKEDWNPHGFSSGNQAIDQLIATNGTRFGVDPYLVFLVIEQESHFRTRAISPKGAQGLMQLMPGTARRLGVKRPFDPAENIRGGTQYLKELLTMFNNRVDLALASYNAGEGRVLNYGNRVPPFKETREYVRRISARYRNQKTEKPAAKAPESSRRN